MKRNILQSIAMRFKSARNGSLKDWGKHLMQLLQEVGLRFKMFKVMLTCFKHNEGTLSFYNKLGYSPDVRSPSKCGEIADYEILSLKMKGK